MIDLTSKRPTRHSIFQQLPSRSFSASRSVEQSIPLPITSNTLVEFILRQSLFQCESIESVLLRIDEYNKSQQEIILKLNKQLQTFNKFQTSDFNQEDVLVQIIKFSQILQEYEEKINSYSMIKQACPSNAQNIGLVFNSGPIEVKQRITKIITEIKNRRNTLLQHSIQSQHQMAALDIKQQAKMLQSYIESNHQAINQMMIFILKSQWKHHLNNQQTLLLHKNIFLRIETLFQSMKMMTDDDKDIPKIIDAMNLHFINLISKLDSPHELKMYKDQFTDQVKIKHQEIVHNKKLFHKNISNSFIRDYKSQFDKFILESIKFDKAYEQFIANSKVFDILYELKSKLEQKIFKRDKSKQDIQQIKNIYRAILDLNVNKQVADHKQYIIKRNQQNLRKLGIQVQKIEEVNNYLLEQKIKLFHRTIEGGLKYMSVHLEQFLIFESEVAQIQKTTLKNDEKILCDKYWKQVQIAIKIIQTYNIIKQKQYDIVVKSLYYLNQIPSLSNIIMNKLTRYFNKMYMNQMIQPLQDLFYKYIRDMFIIMQIQTQYIQLKNKYIERRQQFIDIEANYLKNNQIQLIFPILKSIRDISEVNEELKKYLYQNVFKIYSEFIMTVFQNSYSVGQLKQDRIIEDNPQNFNNFFSLCYCEVLRQQGYFESKDLFLLLEKTIQFVCINWIKFSIKQKVMQLIKFYFFSLIFNQKNMKKFINYQFCISTLNYIYQYLLIDTQIRMIVPVQQRLTYKSPLFFQLIKLSRKKNLLKYNRSESNTTTSSIYRLINQRESISPFKLNLKNSSVDDLIMQLKIIESDNEMKQLLNFTNIPKVGLRAFLYYYIENIVGYKSCSKHSQSQIIVTKNNKKYQVDMRQLNSETLSLFKVYDKWVEDVHYFLRTQITKQANYFYQFQHSIFEAIK